MSVTKYRSHAMRARIIKGEVPEWIERHKRKPYIKAAYLAIPLWVDLKKLDALEHLRNALTRETGVLHVIAHLIPLNHPNVCGLTVPENLKIVPYSVNASEGNRWNEEQLVLWPNSPLCATRLNGERNSSYSAYFASRNARGSVWCGGGRPTQTVMQGSIFECLAHEKEGKQANIFSLAYTDCL